MFVRNLLRPSDFVTPIPCGMPATLQYDENGVLKKIYWGHEEASRVDCSARMLAAAKVTDAIKPFPFKIPLKSGTTWVMGVLYADCVYSNSCGDLPSCIRDEFLDIFDQYHEQFHFFAGCVTSLATQFKGAANIRRWLDMSGFDVLPGFLAPAQITEESVAQCITHCQYPFNPSTIVSYIIFRGTEVLYANTGLQQYTVEASERYTDSSGHIKSRLSLVGSDKLVFVNYSELVNFNICENSVIVINNAGQVVSCHNEPNRGRTHSHTITCKYCGMSFKLPSSGLVKCPNSSCLSHKYPRAVKLLTTLGLPLIKFDTYESHMLSKDILTLVDLLDTDAYASSKVETSLGRVLEATVPVEVCHDSKMFVTFANQCNNSVATFEFYLQHPDRILTNLNLTGPAINSLVSWLSVSENCLEVLSLLHHPRLSVTSVDRRFNGAPIFRNKTIMITGKFQHGSIGDIISILNSYSATVVTSLSPDVQCLVVGDIPEDVNGAALQKCRKLGIPVYTESQFFERFQIDEDLRANLL